MMPKIQTAAFYLPQFHPTRVNDKFWGPGFTEWTNVTRAKPRFTGHRQPKLPGQFGFYDLRCVDTIVEQAELASIAGIDAFCFYYYRFGAQRMLHRPVDLFLARRNIHMKFFYCWANENWTRAWDGKTDEVLLEQSYNDQAIDLLTADLIEAIADPRYFRIADKPAFLIYQSEEFLDAGASIERIKSEVHSALGEELLVGAVYSHGFRPEMLTTMDFVVQFPPHRMPRSARKRALLKASKISGAMPELGDFFEAYDSIVASAMNEIAWLDRMFLGVTPNWDNSPRRATKAHIVVDSTPEKFMQWVAAAGAATLRRAARDEIPGPVLFVNAWNEWAEGAQLEPCADLGTAYLDALTEGIARAEQEAKTLSHPVPTA